MHRVSKRKFTSRALAAVSVDIKSKQPNVSEDIQLVYVVDNIGEQLFGHGAVGDFTPNLGGGIHHILQGECRNRRGMIIEEVTGSITNGSTIQVCNIGTAAVSAPITTPFIEPIGINEGLPVQAQFISGGVLTAFFLSDTVGYFRIDLGATFSQVMKGLFVGFGRFFQIVTSKANTKGEWSVRWKELSD